MPDKNTRYTLAKGCAQLTYTDYFGYNTVYFGIW